MTELVKTLIQMHLWKVCEFEMLPIPKFIISVGYLVASHHIIFLTFNPQLQTKLMIKAYG
jgi:hypothetical protein